jgi:hypothetical protein
LALLKRLEGSTPDRVVGNNNYLGQGHFEVRSSALAVVKKFKTNADSLSSMETLDVEVSHHAQLENFTFMGQQGISLYNVEHDGGLTTHIFGACGTCVDNANPPKLPPNDAVCSCSWYKHLALLVTSQFK